MSTEQKRRQTSKQRISPQRRQFLVDVIMHDIELLDLGVPVDERRESIKRFVRTFDRQGCQQNDDKH